MSNRNNDIEKPYYIVYPLPEYVDIGAWNLYGLIGYSNSIGVAKMYYKQMIDQDVRYKNIANIVCIPGKNISEVADILMDTTGIKITKGNQLSVYSDVASSNEFTYVVTDAFCADYMSTVIDESFSIYKIHPVIVALKRMIIICKFLNNQSQLLSLIQLLYKFYIVRLILCSEMPELTDHTKELFKLSEEDYYYEVIYINKIFYDDYVSSMFSQIINDNDEELPFK